jgi:hypothetical protein
MAVILSADEPMDTDAIGISLVGLVCASAQLHHTTPGERLLAIT